MLMDQQMQTNGPKDGPMDRQSRKSLVSNYKKMMKRFMSLAKEDILQIHLQFYKSLKLVPIGWDSRTT